MYSGGPSSPACATVEEALGPGAVEHRTEVRRRVPGLRRVEPDARRCGPGTGAPPPASPSPRRRSGDGGSTGSAGASRRASSLAVGAAPRVMPPITVSKGIPRSVWVWGSKKISAWRTPSAAARRRYAHRQVGRSRPRSRAPSSRRSRCRGTTGGRRTRRHARTASTSAYGSVDAVAIGELEHQLRLERPLDVQVELGLGERRDVERHDSAHRPADSAAAGPARRDPGDARAHRATLTRHSGRDRARDNAKSPAGSVHHSASSKPGGRELRARRRRAGTWR